MANNVIRLKQASSSGAVPSALANGELGLDHFTGNLWFKAANGAHKLINAPGAGAQSPDYGTINANGTLVVSATQGDILTFIPGTGIGISGFSGNDTIRIENTRAADVSLGKVLARNLFFP